MRVAQVGAELLKVGIETVGVIPEGSEPVVRLFRQNAVELLVMKDLQRLRSTLDPRVHIRYLTRLGSNIRELRRLMRFSRIDLVHVNGMIHFHDALAARLEGVPVVWHLNDTSTPDLLRWALLPLVMRWATVVGVASEEVGRHYFGDGWEELGLHVLYAPVNCERFRAGTASTSLRRTLGLPSEAQLVGAVGNIVPVKGHEYLVEAAARVIERCPRAHFVIAGAETETRTNYARSLLARVDQLGMAERVHMLGRRDDLPEVLRNLDVFVQSSLAEACPMATLEASASGVPVVATAVGGTPEIVINGESGLLVAPRSPRAIADAVVRLLNDADERAAMGLSGRARMVERFSLPQCVDRHAAMYRHAIARGRV